MSLLLAGKLSLPGPLRESMRLTFTGRFVKDKQGSGSCVASCTIVQFRCTDAMDVTGVSGSVVTLAHPTHVALLEAIRTKRDITILEPLPYLPCVSFLKRTINSDPMNSTRGPGSASSLASKLLRHRMDTAPLIQRMCQFQVSFTSSITTHTHAY